MEDRYRHLRRLSPRARRLAIRAASLGATTFERAIGAARAARAGRAHPAPEPMPVTFLVWNAFSLGGTVRTVSHQANALAARGHPVEVISVRRRVAQRQPFFAYHPDVKLTTLVDDHELLEPAEPRTSRREAVRGRIRRSLANQPSLLNHPAEGRAAQASLLTDLRLVRVLGRIREGTVVGTRLGLNLFIARFAHPAATTVAQEHLFLGVYKPPLPDGIARHFPKLDAVAALTDADADAYRRHLDGHPVLVAKVPNSISDELPQPADPTTRRVIGVGKLDAGGKGFDRLIPAFARAARHHPDWELRLVGPGSSERLERRATELGIRDQVVFAGPTKEVMRELSTASVIAMPSRFEAFSLVLLEGMAAGLAVVSFDCREGPRDILTPGVDGLVVPQGDIEAFGDALDLVMSDLALREQLCRNGRRTVEQRYLASGVTDRWVELYEAAERHRLTGDARVPPELSPSPAAEERLLPDLVFQAEIGAGVARPVTTTVRIVESSSQDVEAHP